MTKEFEDLLIEFDEMGFEPTTLCENPQREIETFRNRLEQALTEKQDLERFTRLVMEKNVNCYVIKISINVEHYNTTVKRMNFSPILPYEIYYSLTEEEFTFIKEMIAKYGKSI